MPDCLKIALCATAKPRCKIVHGTFMVVGTAGEDFTSLTPQQFACWTYRFLYCEQMIYFDNEIVAVPIADGSAEAEDEKDEKYE